MCRLNIVIFALTTLERGYPFWQTGEVEPKVHSTFHVSNLKKCLSNELLAILLNEIHIDDKLHFVEEPVEIMDREVKRLKQSRILIARFDGTLGEVLSSHGNVKINFERSTHISLQKPHPRQVSHLESCVQGSFNAGRL
ncbi:hypothetical protein Tco_0269925 [Tanacetum coccineum]